MSNTELSEPQDIKQCNNCKEHFPLVFFHKDSKSKDGLKRVCKACRNEKSREYYHKKIKVLNDETVNGEEFTTAVELLNDHEHKSCTDGLHYRAKYISNYGYIVDSIHEVLIADLLHDLGYHLQCGVWFKQQDLNADFVIMGHAGSDWPEENWLYIEYWGFKSNGYNQRRAEKTETYAAMGWKLIDIEWQETRDMRKLRTRLREELIIG
jgi:hypothetical protein